MPGWIQDLYRFHLLGEIKLDDLTIFPGSKDTDPFALEFHGFAAYRPGAPMDDRYISVYEWFDYLRDC